MPGKKAKDKKDWKTQSIRVRLSEDDCQAIKQIAIDRGISISDLVRTLIPTPAMPEEDPQNEEAQAEVKEIRLPGYPGTFTVHNKKRKNAPQHSV